jgi:integrase
VQAGPFGDEYCYESSDAVAKRKVPQDENHPSNLQKDADDWTTGDAILQAGLDGLRFQDLRRTAVVRLAEAGCTDPEIAAITGHSLKRTKQNFGNLPPPALRRWPRNALAKWESKPGTRVGTQGEKAK